MMKTLMVLMFGVFQAKEKVKRKELGELTGVPPSAAVRDQAVQVTVCPDHPPEKNIIFCFIK